MRQNSGVQSFVGPRLWGNRHSTRYRRWPSLHLRCKQHAERSAESPGPERPPDGFSYAEQRVSGRVLEGRAERRSSLGLFPDKASGAARAKRIRRIAFSRWRLQRRPACRASRDASAPSRRARASPRMTEAAPARELRSSASSRSADSCHYQLRNSGHSSTHCAHQPKSEIRNR